MQGDWPSDSESVQGRLAGSTRLRTCSVEAPQPGWQWQDSDDALKAYTALIGTLALGSIPGFRNLHHIELPYFITLASATIYIGAHRSRFVAFVEKWQGLLLF